MPSRDFLKHVVSTSEPAGSGLGDQWYNPTTNALSVRLAVSGTNKIWVETLLASPNLNVSGNLAVGGTVAVGGTLTTVGPAGGITGAQFIYITGTDASISTATGALQVAGGIGVGGNLNVGGVITATNMFIGPWAVSTGTGASGVTSLTGSSGTSVSSSTGAVIVWFNTSTLVATAVLAQTATTATNAATAYSLANTSTTFVGFANLANSATTATNAATAYALANTSTTYVGRAVLTDTATTATSAGTAYSTVAVHTAGTGLSGSTFNGSTAQTWTLNTATLMATAVLAQTATTATSAATAYALANTGTTYVSRAVLADTATTATSAATAYSLANTSTTFVGFANLANSATTATNAAIAYSLANTSTTFVGFANLANSATTATNAATAYGWTGGNVQNQSTFQSGIVFGSTSQNPILIGSSYSQQIPSFIVANGTLIGTTQTTAIYAFNYQHNLAPVSTTTIGNYYGQLFLPTLTNTATYTNMYGAFARIDMNAGATSGTVGTWIGFISETPSKNAAADVRFTNHYGFRALDPSTITATNVRGYDSNITVGANRFNVYAGGSASNFFNGSVGIGTAGPNAKLEVVGAARFSGTATITDVTAGVSTTTGALVVAGGVGVGGNVYVKGNIYTNGIQILPANIQEFTASAGQTVFTVSGGYTVGTVVVVANGVELGNADITATNGTTVTLGTARKVNDIIRIKSGPASADTFSAAKSFSIAMSVALGS